MRVQDVMTTSVETVVPTADVAVASELMRRRSIHHLVVVEGTSIRGLFSSRDAGGRRGVTARKGQPVSEFMTAPVVTVSPDATVRKAANLMRGRSIGSLVVTDDGGIVGIVTVADLLELLGRGTERPVETGKRWTLKHRSPHRKRATSAGVW